MIEHHNYECEYCHELFDTEEEYQVDNFKGQFHCYDEDGTEIELNDNTIPEIYYIKVSSPAVINLIQEFFERSICADNPASAYNAEYPLNYLYYSLDNSRWKNLADEFHELKEIESIFMKNE